MHDQMGTVVVMIAAPLVAVQVVAEFAIRPERYNVLTSKMPC